MCSKRGMVREGTTRRGATGRPAFCGIRRESNILFVLVAAVACGCGRNPGPPAPSGPPPVSLALVDHAELMATVARHRGQVVVLDCWSTSCPPCVREFPRLVALADRYAGQVACLSLAFDFEGVGTPEDAVPQVREFLVGVRAGRVTNLLSREEADTMYRKLGLESVPAVYVWKPDGTLARRFDADDAARRLGRPFSYDDIEIDVRSLLQP